MAKNKTTTTTVSVESFISKVEDETKRDDSHELIKIFKSVTGEDAKMWGPSIIGFGSPTTTNTKAATRETRASQDSLRARVLSSFTL